MYDIFDCISFHHSILTSDDRICIQTHPVAASNVLKTRKDSNAGIVLVVFFSCLFSGILTRASSSGTTAAWWW
jgi:hypothetical protein